MSSWVKAWGMRFAANASASARSSPLISSSWLDALEANSLHDIFCKLHRLVGKLSIGLAANRRRISPIDGFLARF